MLLSRKRLTTLPATAAIFFSCCNISMAAHPSWMTVEYLYWGIENEPLSVPLVTSNPTPGAGGAMGSIGETGTQVIYGTGSSNDAVNFIGFHAAHTTLGGWFDACDQYGLEANFFGHAKRNNIFSASSDEITQPLIAIPYYSVSEGSEAGFNLGSAPNVLTITNNSQTWAGDLNALLDLEKRVHFPLVAMAGLAYFNLAEGLNLNDTLVDTTLNGTVSVMDNFKASNQFYGLQFGARSDITIQNFTLGLLGTLALGENRQNLEITGNTNVANGAFEMTSSNAGLFAEPSNIGNYKDHPFTLLPKVQMRLGYNLAPDMNIFFGYNFLYLSDVIRPGEQLQHNINITQQPTLGPSGGVLTGAALPTLNMTHTHIWMQAFSMGFKFEY